MTNCASLALRRYELRPCHVSSLHRKLNCVTEKSAAREACLPSFPTIPTPVNHVYFRANYPNRRVALLTNVCSLNHADVVSAVADTANTLLGMVPDKTGDIRLLSGRASTGYDGGQFGRDLNKLVLEQVHTELFDAVNVRMSASAEHDELTCNDSPSITRQQSSFDCKNSS